MASLTIFCDDGVKRTVKAAAAAAGVSMSDYYLSGILHKAKYGVDAAALVASLEAASERIAGLEAEIAAVYAKVGEDFEKVRFVEVEPEPEGSRR